ncbi:outer membrane beta-barrel protein [Haliscomenobacter sp.]|uniref:outer membrane beta-barrel protein n=1 Tax=Haliscomenobacter sp. TaxID=2717303 RepID=UPI00359481E4
MKTYHINLLLFLIVILPVSLTAQLNQGQTFINGSFSVNNYNSRVNDSDKTNSSNDFGVYFRGGYLLKDHLALTLGLSIGQSKNTGYNEIYTQAEIRPDGQALYTRQEADTKNTYNNFGLSLGLNRFVSLKERLYLVLDGNFAASFRSGNNSQQIPGQNEQVSEWKQNDVALNFSPGLIYFLSPRFGLSGTFGGFYLRFQPKSDQNYASTLSGGFSTSGVLGIGLNYFFK